MSNALLVLNAGSSSLKASLFRLESGKDNLPLHCRALAERLGGEGQLTLTAADGTALRRLPLPARPLVRTFVREGSPRPT